MLCSMAETDCIAAKISGLRPVDDGSADVGQGKGRKAKDVHQAAPGRKSPYSPPPSFPRQEMRW